MENISQTDFVYFNQNKFRAPDYCGVLPLYLIQGDYRMCKLKNNVKLLHVALYY